jgi:4-methyl-5(b-hydroxyethyl)-thiazole monophosphate biosynthesis
VALENSRVVGAHDIIIHADTTIKNLPEGYDGVVLPGGGRGTDNLKASAQILEVVSTAFAGGLLCAAISAAPVVFAKAGILKGIRATCYPGFEDQLNGALYIEAAVVRDKM